MQKKRSITDRKDLLELLVRVVPFIGIGLVITTLGFRAAHLIPSDGKLVVQIVVLIIFVMLVILENEPFWNFLLFLVFSLGAGVMLFWLCAGSAQAKDWILCVVLFLFSAAASELIPGVSRPVNGALTIGTLLFMIGWIALQFVTLPVWVRVTWSILGLTLFTAALMSIINKGKIIRGEDSALPLSIQFYIILFNLYWLSSNL